jgi:hypothetical protein
MMAGGDRRNHGLQIGRIDRLSPDPELRCGTGGSGNQRAIAFVFEQRMAGDTANRNELAAHHLVETGAHLSNA